MPNKILPFRGVLQRSLVIIAVAFLSVAMAASAYISLVNAEIMQSRDEQRSHQTLAELLVPALAISDFMEIQRLLGLVTKANSIFSVVTRQNNILLSDYTHRNSITQLFNLQDIPAHCSQLTTTKVQLSGQSLNVYCSELEDQPALDDRHKLGILLSLRPSPKIILSAPDFLKLAALIAMSLILAIAFLRNVLTRNILTPVEALVASIQDRMVAQEKEPGTVEPIRESLNTSSEIEELRSTFNALIASIAKSLTLKKELEKSSAISAIAAQVAHDIRSPLSALNMLSGALHEISEDKRLLIRNSIQRINDIANDLLNRGKANPNLILQAPSENLTECLLAVEVESLVSEKRIQFRDRIGVEISTNAESTYGVFVKIDAKEFKRTLSNLINNSVDAFGDRPGHIVVSVKDAEGKVVVCVSDNGRGIPPEVLAKLGTKGVSHGKEGTESGSGIGVYHAKKTIESLGGTFVIESVVGQGTSTIITLPKIAAPKWFIAKLSIFAGSTVVICDDDSAIHGLWKGRLQSLNAGLFKIEIISFTSGALLKEWYTTHGHNVSPILFLMDYELLRQPQSGLDLIAELGIGRQSILVTSRYEEARILDRCSHLNVKQIPKGMAGFVPVEIVQAKRHIDAVVLDDEELQKMTWEFAAKQSNKTVVVFSEPMALMAGLRDFEMTVPFYIDSNLGNGLKGETVAKELFDLGYTNLYLATGYEPAQFGHLSYLKGVVGKDPIFA